VCLSITLLNADYIPCDRRPFSVDICASFFRPVPYLASLRTILTPLALRLARRRARVHPAARRRRSFASRPASSMHSFLCNARLRRSRMRRHRRSIVRPPRRHPHLRSPHHNPYTSAAGDDRTRSETALSAAATHWPSTTANADILDTLQRRSSHHLLSGSARLSFRVGY
jgi:hypothetical protein